MAAPTTRTGLYAQYLGIRTAEMLMSMWPLRSNMRVGAGLGRIMSVLDKRHYQRVRQNLAMAMPHLTDAQRHHYTRQTFEHFVKLVIEIIHSPRLLNPDSWGQASHLNMQELAPACALLNSGKPVILLTGHFGNWEIMGTMLALMGYPLDAIARPLDNALLNEWITGVREKRGLRIITKWDATERMLEVLDAGGALGFIADQNAGDRGLFVPFFGKLASTYKSIGLLAIRQDVPIVCGYACRRHDQLGYELGATDIIYPQDWQNRHDALYYVTARYMRAIEAMVCRAPGQYLWMHRRWKSRPRHERLGKPMPDSLKRNLEALPWMDDALMDSVCQPLPAPK